MKFEDLLHKYKLEHFHRQHVKLTVEVITTASMHISNEVLKQKYHYHFKQLPSADRAEVINMINSYTREAILPPVIEKLVQRQVLLEKRFEALLHLTEQILEELSAERPAHNGR